MYRVSFIFRLPKGIDHIKRRYLNKPRGANHGCWFTHDVTNYKTFDPTEILLSWCIRAAETYFQTNFRFKRVLGFVIEYA